MQKTGFTKTVNGAFSKVKTKIMNLIKFGSVSLVLGDKGKYSQTQITYLGQTSNVTTLYPYGTYGNAPAKSLAVMFNIQGDESNKIAIVQDYESRFKNLLAGEVVHGNALTGSHVYYLSGGDVALTVKGAYTINTDGDYGLTLGGNHNVVGNEYTAIYSGNYSLSAGNAVISAGTDGKYSLTTTDDITFNPQGINPLTGLFTVNGDIAAGAISAVDLNISGTATFESGSETVFDGSILVNDTITFAGSSSIISEGDSNGRGALNLTTPEFINAIIDGMDNGLTSVDGDDFSLVTFHPTNPSWISILGGQGRIIDDTIIGRSLYKNVTWNAEPDFDPGGVPGNYIVAVDSTGAIALINNNNSSYISPADFLDHIPIGTMQIVDDNGSPLVTGAFSVAYPSTNKGLDLYTLGIAIGAFNSAVSGYRIEPKIGNLQLIQRDGTAFIVGGNPISYRDTDNAALGFDLDPIPLVGMGNPVTGAFVFSGTGEIDPTFFSRSGVIVSVSDGPGAGNITFTASIAHNMNVGEEISIMNTINYNNAYTIIAKTATTIRVVGTFVASETGNWSGLSIVANNQFTAQRTFLFPTSFVAIVYYGQREYASVDAFRSAGGQNAESFVEPSLTSAAISLDTIVVSQAATDLSIIAQAEFIPTTTRIR